MTGAPWLQNGKHHIRFLVNNEWQLSQDLPTEEAENGELCNVLSVNAADSIHVYCNTGWPSAMLRSRMLDAAGHPLSDVRPLLGLRLRLHPEWAASKLTRWLLVQWAETPMSATQSCLLPWKVCSIPAPRGEGNVAEPCKLEFTVLGPNGDEDKPSQGDAYLLPGAGGYKLSHGTIRPFPQACQAPIMLVRSYCELVRACCQPCACSGHRNVPVMRCRYQTWMEQ